MKDILKILKNIKKRVEKFQTETGYARDPSKLAISKVSSGFQ